MLKVLLNEEQWKALDASLQGLYTKQGDEYILQVDETDYKGRLGEFRENNKKLAAEREQLMKTAERFKGIDPEKYKEAMTALEHIDAMQDKELLKAGKLDEIIAKRTGSMQRDFETKLNAAMNGSKELETKYKTASERLHTMMVESAVSKAIQKVGVLKKNAMMDVLNRARNHWTVDPETQELKSKDLYDSKAAPITDMDTYAKQLLEQTPYLFEPATGGGAGGGNGNAGAGNGGPVTKVDWNDPAAVGANMDAIRKGKAQVVRT